MQRATIDNPTIASLVAPEVLLNEAWEWLCKRRLNYPPSADIWWLRQHWTFENQKLIRLLSSGDYQFEPLQQVTKSDGEIIELWSAQHRVLLM